MLPIDDRGYATVSFVAAVGVSLVVFVAVANLLVFAYARGAARVALDEGVRAGMRAGEAAECVRRVERALDDLLGGPLREAWDDVVCEADRDGNLRAAAGATLPAWAPGIPDWPVAEEAVAAGGGAP